MLPVIPLLGLMLLFGPASQAGAIESRPLWPATIRLEVNGPAYEGNIPNHLQSSCQPGLSRSAQFLYEADVLPGGAYTLGLTVPHSDQKVRILLFDRSPYAPGATSFRLPSGPVVKTRGTRQNFFWHFSISPQSAGRHLHILLEISAQDGKTSRFSHRISILSPPIRPSLTRGQGMTFLQGPRNMQLAAGREH